MLFTPKVQAALEAKQSHFKAYQNSLQEQQELVVDWLAKLAQQSAASLSALLDERGVAWPGARPTAEFDRAPNLLLSFDNQWGNHVDARGWAMSVLKERPVAAVDGSQITPSKDFSIAVGAVQVGWFINFHEEGGRYIKDVEFEVLAPGELDQEAGDSSEHSESTFPTQQVNCLRFVRECERLCAIMAEYAGVAERQRPLCIFDGSFIISFAGQMTPTHAQPYVRAVRQVLECSERYRVPLVGFVDSSLSKDLVTMLEVMQNRPGGLRYTDGGLLRTVSLLNGWGDRTPFFFCGRDDRLSRNGLGDFYGDVAFSYVQLSMGRPPARLEVPRWLVEAGWAEDAVDLVRAECVVGMGYPYAIETADALAVISQQDRQRFFRLLEQFATRNRLTFTQARKALSKQIRR
jgi:hypothetical protein